MVPRIGQIVSIPKPSCVLVLSSSGRFDENVPNSCNWVLIMWCGVRGIPLPRLPHLIALALAILAAGCGESTVAQITGAGLATRCQTALTGVPSSLQPSAARLTATISTNRECQWTIESEASWVQVTPNSGQGEASVAVVVAENPAAINRSTAPRRKRQPRGGFSRRRPVPLRASQFVFASPARRRSFQSFRLRCVGMQMECVERGHVGASRELRADR